MIRFSIVLIEDCFKCGCPEGYTCEPENRTCVIDGYFKIEQNVGSEEQEVLDRIVNKEGEGIGAIRLIPVSFLGNNNLIMNFDGVKITFSMDMFGKPKVDVELKENT